MFLLDMRTYKNVKIQNVRIQDGSFDVKTQRSGSYSFDIKNHYRIDPSKLSEVMKCVDEWIASVYSTAERQGIDKPFNAEIDTDTGQVESVSVSMIGATGLSQSLSEEISSNFLRSNQVNKKR